MLTERVVKQNLPHLLCEIIPYSLEGLKDKLNFLSKTIWLTGSDDEQVQFKWFRSTNYWTSMSKWVNESMLLISLIVAMW